MMQVFASWGSGDHQLVLNCLAAGVRKLSAYSQQSKSCGRSTLLRVYPIDSRVGMLLILAFKYLVCDKDLLIVK